MAGMDAIPVLYEDDSLLVAVKPAGVPTAPLKALSGIGSEPESLLEAVSRTCPAVLSVHGKKEVEGGLLHRIDTATTGLVLIAKSQQAYDALSAEQDAGRFMKTYTAVCYANRPLPQAPFTVQSLFRPFGAGSRGVKPVFAESGRADRKKAGSREYVTEVLSVTALPETGGENQLFLVTAQITAGYRHQVRTHLASAGLPVLGDPLYPAIWTSESGTVSGAGSGLPLYFYASGLSVTHPVTGKLFTVTLPESFLFPLPDKNCR
ncbi:MAG: pseudouridine synthase [Treponemataceae bacterium]|nr:pseudouridine synthase [Treponemataceae bacterium]